MGIRIGNEHTKILVEFNDNTHRVLSQKDGYVYDENNGLFVVTTEDDEVITIPRESLKVIGRKAN